MVIEGLNVEGIIKIDNARVYGLEESMIASGYPLSTISSNEKDIENFKKCMEYNIFSIIDILKGDGKQRAFEVNEELNCVNMKIGNSDRNVFISFEDLEKVSSLGWTFNQSRGYIQSTSRPYVELQRFLLGDGELVVDHINRDTFDNRRENLRLVTRSQNTHNRGVLESNKTGVTGVYFSKNKNRWIASIEFEGKVITRSFKEKEKAIKKRLELENDLLGEFSPQKYLFELYGIEDSWENKKLEKLDFVKAINHCKRIKHLGNAIPGSGHDCFLKGIIIQFDMKVPEYIWRQWDRYHFNDYVSSQSKMHRILKLDLDKNCNKYVDTRTINILDDYIKRYNNFEESDKNKDLILRGKIVEYTKENLFNCIIANCPSGLMLTARVTLNYLQAKSIKLQRKTHKMQEWHYICDFFDSLPRFKELTEKNK